VAIGFQNWHFVPLEGGTPEPKHAGCAPLIFVLITTAYLVAVTNGALRTNSLSSDTNAPAQSSNAVHIVTFCMNR